MEKFRDFIPFFIAVIVAIGIFLFLKYAVPYIRFVLARTGIKKAVASSPNAKILHKGSYMLKTGNDGKTPDMLIAAGNTLVILKIFGTIKKTNTIRIKNPHQVELLRPAGGKAAFRNAGSEPVNAITLRYKATDVRVKLDSILREDRYADVKAVSANLYVPSGLGVMHQKSDDRSFPMAGEELFGIKMFVSTKEIAAYMVSIADKPTPLSSETQTRLVKAIGA